ncbi:MAG: response regulator transcription factor [Blautia sp.]|jgi:DNA-binding response OmpR family regulator
MHLLLIEDDQNLCETLKYQFEQEHITVDICHDGRDGLDLMLQNAHDLVILDRMLPTMNGLMALKKARDNHIETPVILLTALGELYDRIEGLDCGADDYMVKPFEFEELMARIRSIRRRSKNIVEQETLSLGDVSYDISLRQLSTKHHQLILSKREGRLMEVFLRSPDTVLPRMVILSRVWGPDAEVEEGNLDNYIHFLRKRLLYVQSRLTITTIRGIGYKLETAYV